MTTEICLDLPGGTLTIELVNGEHGLGGSVSSNLHYSWEEWCNTFPEEVEKDGDRETWSMYEGAIDALESLVLGHACAGIDVEAEPYLEGLTTMLDAIGNNL